MHVHLKESDPFACAGTRAHVSTTVPLWDEGPCESGADSDFARERKCREWKTEVNFLASRANAKASADASANEKGTSRWKR